jgi:hypothetical protein
VFFERLLSVCQQIVKPLYKHHQTSQKLHHSRWIKRSDERRAKLGRPKWTPPTTHGTRSVPVGGNIWPVAIYWSFLTVGSNGAQFPGDD